MARIISHAHQVFGRKPFGENLSQEAILAQQVGAAALRTPCTATGSMPHPSMINRPKQLRSAHNHPPASPLPRAARLF